MGRRTFHYNKKAFKEWGPRASFLRLVIVPPFLGPPGLKQLLFQMQFAFLFFCKELMDYHCVNIMVLNKKRLCYHFIYI